MLSLLIVSQKPEYRAQCRSALRKAGYRVVAKDDIIEGLKELRWFRPSLIIWDIDPSKLREVKALLVLRQQYAQVKLLLVLEKDELTMEIKKSCDGVISRNLSPKKIAAKVSTLIGQPELLKPDEEELQSADK